MTVSDDTFLHLRVGEGTIGFDGCGAIDLQRSEIGWAPEPDDIYQEEFDRMTAPSAAQIVMRRAVKPFDVLLVPRHNVVLLHPDMEGEAWVARSVSNLVPVTCHFGKRQMPRLFGNLTVHDALDQVVWPASRFHRVNSSNFHINQSRIERGQVPPDHVVDLLDSNLVFQTRAEERKAWTVLTSFIPADIALETQAVDMIHMGPTQLLIRKSLYEAILARPRPKSRVSGIVASGPEAVLRFKG